MSSHRVRNPQFLVGHWTLNSHASDVSGYGNDGAVSGMLYTDGAFGRDVGVFDGNDDNVNLGDLTYLNSVSAFSWTAWINQDVAGASDRLFVKVGAGNNRIRIITFTDNKLYFEVQNGANTYVSFTYTTVIPAGSWRHLACIFDGGQSTANDRIHVYVDGDEQALTVSGTLPTTTADMSTVDAIIGDTGTSWDGKVGDVRIYNIALTGDEVVEVMEMGKL